MGEENRSGACYGFLCFFLFCFFCVFFGFGWGLQSCYGVFVMFFFVVFGWVFLFKMKFLKGCFVLCFLRFLGVGFVGLKGFCLFYGHVSLLGALYVCLLFVLLNVWGVRGWQNGWSQKFVCILGDVKNAKPVSVVFEKWKGCTVTTAALEICCSRRIAPERPKARVRLSKFTRLFNDTSYIFLLNVINVYCECMHA